MPTQEQLYRQLAVSNPLIQEDIDSQVIKRNHIIDTDEEEGKEIDTVLKTIERDPVRSLREGIGSQATGTITKDQLKNIGKFGSQLGLDVLTGSAIAEALGLRPDIIQGEGYTPSYPELVEETAQLAKEGKRTEALGKGIETGLVGVGAVGEGMMLGGALTGPLAPAIIGAGLTLKGISKAGKLILQSKTGQKVLANFTGSKDTGYNVTDIEIPKNITEDKEIQTLEEIKDIPTIKTDDTDTEVVIGPPVFSRLEEAVKNLKQEKGKGKDIFNEIRGKFRREEGEWIGLEKFLKDKESVTKEEILEYIRENDIPIKTKVREGKETIHKKWSLKGGKNYREITFYPELPMDGRRDYKPSHHYPQDLNLISRVRVAERIDADGNPTMHIEETQSEHRNDILENKKQTYEQTGEIGLIDDKETTEKLNNLLRERVPLRSTLGAKIKKLRHEHNLDDITEKGKLALQQELDLLIIRRKNFQKIISEEGFNPGTYSKTELKVARNRYVDHTKKIKELENKRKVMIAREKDFHDNVITMDKDIPSLQNKLSKLDKEIKAIERTRKVPSLPYSTDKDWYKYPIRHVMYDAAEKGLDSITLTHGRVQYNRYEGRKDDFLSYTREIDKIKASEKISKNFDEFVKDAHKLINLNEEIRLKKKLLGKQILEPSPNTDHHEIYRDITQLNAKTEEEYTKIFHKYGLNMLEPEIRKNILNDLLKVANITGDKKFKKQHMLKLFNINSSARVGYNYDTKMKSYLEDLAKQYNTTVDKTIVDSNIEGDSYRLHLTPEVRAKILKEGIAKFKTGGYIKERI